MARAPLIGILLDFCQSGSFSRRPHYALRRHYFDAIRRAGGVAMALPAEGEGLEDALARLDGLLVPGGFFPSPPEVYVDNDPAAPAADGAHPRASADLMALAWALRHKVPVLGICAGMQGLAVAAGAKMVRDVHAHTGTVLDHLNGAPPEERYHALDLVAGSRLRVVLGRAPLAVNSAHREAVVEVPDGLSVSARASADGVIEGIEVADHPFALGVQWHPEFFTDPAEPDFALFRALVTAARDVA